MNIYDMALRSQDELAAIRRRLHQNAEAGGYLPKTAEFVSAKLKEMGYRPEEICKSGIVATAGTGERVILLRADMDALPIAEESGEPFACSSGAMHACGHDFHTAMLLGVAKILKEKESELKGVVKLMFQPGEEILWGGRAMVEAGVLESPKVDRALSLHVMTGAESGAVSVRKGAVMSSCNGFKIKIKGKGSHGARPEAGVDPINIGVHIHLALQELISREVPLINGALLTIGAFNSGSATNVIPDTAELQGSIRTFNESLRGFMVDRMKTIATDTARMFRGEAEVEIISDTPVLQNDPDFTDLMIKYTGEIPGLRAKVSEAEPWGGSEDFSLIAASVPSTMFFLGADPVDKDKIYPLHHPKITFNEDAIPVGVTILAENAMRWLREHS